MKSLPRLLALERAAKFRRLAVILATGVPGAVAAAWVVQRIAGSPYGWIVAALALVAVAAWATRATREIDRAWVARRLDALLPELEDSALLLYPASGPEAGLAALQRARIAGRLEAQTAVDIREAWPRRRLGYVWLAALVIAALAGLWPRGTPVEPDRRAQRRPSESSSANATVIAGARLEVVPPAYTGLPARVESDLAARVESGATVRWHLRFEPIPAAATIVFHDGTELALARDGDAWLAERTLDASTLYRLRVDSAPPLADDRLYRLELVPDTTPELRVIAPDKTLTLVEPGQRRWDLAFEARDDYGLGQARLTVTLAKGSGEQVEVSERSFVLEGEGDARTRTYRRTLDLATLGIAAGDDAIARLTISDNRAPKPNVSRSPGLILRWPAQQGSETSGMDGLVERTLPAYFRSQRQIIIDTEALVAQRAGLAHDEFVDRSDSIGADQKILRLRYGQFLGEEAETYGEHAAEGHDEGAATTPFGSATDVLQTFGHAHDIAEAATLFDPQTRDTLRAALSEMWQAELQLRLGEPRKALPYEYAALDYIKRVQQASRIYLSRVGLDLPVVDEARRLTGERTGVRDRASALGPRNADDAVVLDVWRALADTGTPDWDGFESWVRQREATLPAALDLLAATDALRRDPDCAACRDRLYAQLWPLLPVPATGAGLRETPDEAGRAYLDAIEGPLP